MLFCILIFILILGLIDQVLFDCEYSILIYEAIEDKFTSTNSAKSENEPL